MSTPEQPTAFAVAAGAGITDMPALKLSGPQAQKGKLQAPGIPGPVSPPRFAHTLMGSGLGQCW